LEQTVICSLESSLLATPHASTWSFWQLFEQTSYLLSLLFQSTAVQKQHRSTTKYRLIQWNNAYT